MKGMKGEWGEKGSKGSKGETFQVNWRQCVWTDDDDTDAGKIRVHVHCCMFMKPRLSVFHEYILDSLYNWRLRLLL